METMDYILAWGVYLVCGISFSILSWRFLKRMLWRSPAYLIQSILVAVIFTPWYVLPDEEIMAPAIIVFLLDLITIDVTTSIRALIPLVMAMLLGIIIAVILSVIYRVRRHKSLAKVIVDEEPV